MTSSKSTKRRTKKEEERTSHEDEEVEEAPTEGAAEVVGVQAVVEADKVQHGHNPTHSEDRAHLVDAVVEAAADEAVAVDVSHSPPMVLLKKLSLEEVFNSEKEFVAGEVVQNEED